MPPKPKIKPRVVPGRKTDKKSTTQRNMAGKKGATVALQIDVATEDDWHKLLEKEGLIVADIYTEWCGPCLGMVGNLKKLKLESGSDFLHLAIVKSDYIEELARFRNKSEPTWMFIANKQIVNLMFGANAPRLNKMVIQELEKETKALKGEGPRTGIPFNELTEEEKKRAEEARKKEEEERAREAKELADKLEALKIRNLTKLARMLLTRTVIVYFPHMIDENHTCNAAFKMLAQYDQVHLAVVDQMEVQLTEETVPELFYNTDMYVSEAFLNSLKEKPVLASLLHYLGPDIDEESPKPASFLGIVEEKFSTFIYGHDDHKNPVMHSIAYNFLTNMENGEVWPGVWTPKTYISKASAIKVLFPNIPVSLNYEEESLPPPQYVIVFEASRANEVSEVVEEYQNEILNIAFFDCMEPEKAKIVCKHIKDLDRLSPEKIQETKMVMAVAKKTSDPLLAFSQLGPLYISPDLKTGEQECNMYFPPKDLLVDDEEEDEEEGEEEDEEGEEGDEVSNTTTRKSEKSESAEGSKESSSTTTAKAGE